MEQSFKKLMLAPLANKFLIFYGIQRVITILKIHFTTFIVDLQY
jgi:hypothetical protein